ncbi:MAG: UDP-2,3-diacylglucosamine diphosphatase [Elusimicrobiota bacterium]
MAEEITVKQYRTIWISDIHLGTRNSKADFLLDFFKYNESRYLYLVGDIIDGWQLKSSWYWTQSHNDVIQKILRKARKGTKVFYVPGNHDEFLRHFGNIRFGEISMSSKMVHKMADGRKFLVMHGDQFDGVMQHARWLVKLGDHAYEIALTLNHWFNVIRRFLGFDYWSISAYLKSKVKNAVSFMSTYEQTVADSAKQQGVDGIICGHIHKAEIKTIDGILYCNDGDWVESCTALVEHFDGKLELVQWASVGNEEFAPSTLVSFPSPVLKIPI